MKASGSDRPRVALAVVLSVTLAGCATQDFSGDFVLVLDAEEGSRSVTSAFQHPSIARTTIDFGIINDGEVAAHYAAVVQSRTMGDDPYVVTACERAADGASTSLSAIATASSDTPTIRAERDVSSVSLGTVSDDGRAFVRLRPDEAGVHAIFARDIGGLALIEGSTGDRLAPLERSSVAPCPSILGTIVTYDLEAETEYFIRLEAAAVGEDPLLFVRSPAGDTCHPEPPDEAPPWCPGMEFEPATRTTTPPALEPGERVSGRIPSDEAGIGDLLLVDFSCDRPGCSGRLEIFVLVEDLECRVDSECSRGRVCDNLGYCQESDDGGCSSTGRTSTPHRFWLTLVLSLVAARWRRRRGRHTHLPRGSLLLLALLAFPSSNASATDGSERQVYFQPGLSAQKFTGDVGRFSSTGVGMRLTQGLDLGLVGGYLTIGTDFYLTNQPPPPDVRGLRTFIVAAGVRTNWDLGIVRLVGGAEYMNLGLSGNALRRFTGPDLTQHGLGIRGGARLEALLPLYVELNVNGHAFPWMRDVTWMYGSDIAVGVVGSF